MKFNAGYSDLNIYIQCLKIKKDNISANEIEYGKDIYFSVCNASPNESWVYMNMRQQISPQKPIQLSIRYRSHSREQPSEANICFRIMISEEMIESELIQMHDTHTSFALYSSVFRHKRNNEYVNFSDLRYLIEKDKYRQSPVVTWFKAIVPDLTYAVSLTENTRMYFVLFNTMRIIAAQANKIEKFSKINGPLGSVADSTFITAYYMIRDYLFANKIISCFEIRSKDSYLYMDLTSQDVKRIFVVKQDDIKFTVRCMDTLVRNIKKHCEIDFIDQYLIENLMPAAQDGANLTRGLGYSEILKREKKINIEVRLMLLEMFTIVSKSINFIKSKLRRGLLDVVCIEELINSPDTPTRIHADYFASPLRYCVKREKVHDEKEGGQHASARKQNSR